jgi:hypothetical protein
MYIGRLTITRLAAERHREHLLRNSKVPDLSHLSLWVSVNVAGTTPVMTKSSSSIRDMAPVHHFTVV